MTRSPARSRLSSRSVVTADITTLLASAERGDRAAADAVFAALYDELHRMARRELARRGGGVTLGATTLLHDAYLNISRPRGHRVSRSQPLHGLCVARDARHHHRLRAQPPGAEARRPVRDHVDQHRRRRRDGRRRRADAHQRRARRARHRRRPAGRGSSI